MQDSAIRAASLTVQFEKILLHHPGCDGGGAELLLLVMMMMLTYRVVPGAPPEIVGGGQNVQRISQLPEVLSDDDAAMRRRAQPTRPDGDFVVVITVPRTICVGRRRRH